MADTDTRWVHATNAAQFRKGSVLGWRDETSATGWLTGIVVEIDPNSLRVQVTNIKPGVLK